MSSLRVLEPQHKPTAAPASSDLYEYGWRDVITYHPNGEREWTRIPLTLYDVLHPQEDDVLMPTSEHEDFRNYLLMIIKSLLAHDPAAVVLSDTNVAWDVSDIKPHRPDIAVIFNVRERRNWSTFDVQVEGTRPTLILEITSPKTRALDLEDKYDQYEQLGVEYYALIDIQKRKRGTVRELKGYRLSPEGYVPMHLNDQGWLWLQPLQVWLGVENEMIACYDVNGNRLIDYTELAQARQRAEEQAAKAQLARVEAEARATAEAQRRAELEERLRQLEEELRQRRQQDES